MLTAAAMARDLAAEYHQTLQRLVAQESDDAHRRELQQMADNLGRVRW